MKQQVITPPLLRKASRKVISKKKLRYLAILHSEPYRTLFRDRRVIYSFFCSFFTYFAVSFLAKGAFLSPHNGEAGQKNS